MLDIVLALLVMAVIILFMMMIFRYLDVKTRQEYQSLYDSEYYKRPTGPCPEGCLNGVCTSSRCFNHRPPNPKCCAFDFQCKYCTTRSGEPFARIYENIKQDYQKYQDKEEVDRLNDRIFTENVYIAKINKYIETNKL